ncbi:MAG: IclR family transcriptional regulator [Hyphomicrobiales bacterium]
MERQQSKFPDIRELDEDRAAAGKQDRQFVTALARGLEVLRAFRPGSGPLGNQEIADFTGLPKPTVSRLTYTLTRLGYLNHLARLGKYELGTPVLSLGYVALSNMQVRNIARAEMQELATYADASVALADRDRLSMLYVQNCVGASTLALRIDVGTRVPIAFTSLGRALISAIPDNERQYLMDHIKKRFDGDWRKLRKRIEGCIDEVDSRGFCLVDGEWRQHVRAVAVPLILPKGAGVMALNCAGPTMKLTLEQLETDLGPRLVHLARNVESMVATP